MDKNEPVRKIDGDEIERLEILKKWCGATILIRTELSSVIAGKPIRHRLETATTVVSCDLKDTWFDDKFDRRIDLTVSSGLSFCGGTINFINIAENGTATVVYKLGSEQGPRVVDLQIIR